MGQGKELGGILKKILFEGTFFRLVRYKNLKRKLWMKIVNIGANGMIQ